MLTLSRKKGERICIGDAIVVEVVEVRGRYVKLGVTAPPKVRIMREELLERGDGRQDEDQLE